MVEEKREHKKIENKTFIYDSPSRYLFMTPIRTALKSSNKNPYIFLDKMKQVDAFKKKIEKLTIERDQKENKKDNSE